MTVHLAVLKGYSFRILPLTAMTKIRRSEIGLRLIKGVVKGRTRLTVPRLGRMQGMQKVPNPCTRSSLNTQWASTTYARSAPDVTPDNRSSPR